MIVFADNVYFRRSRTLQLIGLRKILMWVFFNYQTSFMFLLMPVNGFHHGYLKTLFKTDQSTINIEHSLKKTHRLYLAIASDWGI